jgi:hypothetical protein
LVQQKFPGGGKVLGLDCAGNGTENPGTWYITFFFELCHEISRDTGGLSYEFLVLLTATQGSKKVKVRHGFKLSEVPVEFGVSNDFLRDGLGLLGDTSAAQHREGHR